MNISVETEISVGNRWRVFLIGTARLLNILPHSGSNKTARSSGNDHVIVGRRNSKKKKKMVTFREL